MWIKIDNNWDEYKWVCAETGMEPLRKGLASNVKGSRLFYEDDKGTYEVFLTNVNTGQRINPITNEIIKKQ